MYRSPIDVLISDIQHQIAEQHDEEVYKAVVSVGINVDKDELIRALVYDRHQYMKGYADGKAEATPKWIPVTERLPEKKGNYLGFTGSTFMVGYYKGDAVWWIWAYDREGVDLFTHWMPLPEPPNNNT